MQKLVLTFILILFLCIFTVIKTQQDKNIVEVAFSSWGSESEIKLLLPLINNFEKENPNIKIKFMHIPQNYFPKLHLLFASNIAPDVIFINNYYAPKYIESNLLEDLTPYIDKKKYFEKSYRGFAHNSKIYAIPRDVSNLVVFYNKDIFRKNNIPLPNKEWSLNEYIETAKKLTKDINNDGIIDIWGTSFEKDIIFWLPFLYSQNASILSDDKHSILLDDKNCINAINLYANLVNKHKIAPSNSDSASLTMAQMFLQGKIAMHLSGRWLVPKYREIAKFDWDIINFPNGENGSVVSIDASGYALNKNSKNKTEAIKFIEFISSKDSLEKLSQSGLIVPARVDVAYSEKFLEPRKKPKNSIIFLDAIKTGRPTIVNKKYPQLIDRINIAVEPIFLGNKNAQDILTPIFVNELKKYLD